MNDQPIYLMHREYPRCYGSCHRAVSMGVCVPTVTRPLCTKHATGLGTWDASVPRLRRCAQMTRISYEYGQLGASPENAVQDRN